MTFLKNEGRGKIPPAPFRKGGEADGKVIGNRNDRDYRGMIHKTSLSRAELDSRFRGNDMRWIAVIMEKRRLTRPCYQLCLVNDNSLSLKGP